MVSEPPTLSPATSKIPNTLLKENPKVTDNTEGAGEVSSHRSPSDFDLFTISPADNPESVLVNTPLDGSNHLSWSKSMLISLRAKDKVGFITGEIEKPTDDENLARKWETADKMVIAWILNTLTKKIADSFLVVTTTKDLWEELKARYGESSGPYVYQLIQEMNNLRQDGVALLANSGGTKRQNNGSRESWNRRGNVKKEEKYCTYYHEKGHLRETCFQLHGVPDWYKELQKKKGKKKFAAAVNEVDVQTLNSTDERIGIDVESLAKKVQELVSFIKDKGVSEVNHVAFNSFSGPVD